MDSLPKNLFYLLDTERSESTTQVVDTGKEIIQAAEQRLTHREFDQLWDAIAAIEHADELDSFTLGFRLGVQLTLEGLRPVRPENQPSLQK